MKNLAASILAVWAPLMLFANFMVGHSANGEVTQHSVVQSRGQWQSLSVPAEDFAHSMTKGTHWRSCLESIGTRLVQGSPYSNVFHSLRNDIQRRNVTVREGRGRGVNHFVFEVISDRKHLFFSEMYLAMRVDYRQSSGTGGSYGYLCQLVPDSRLHPEQHRGSVQQDVVELFVLKRSDHRDVLRATHRLGERDIEISYR